MHICIYVHVYVYAYVYVYRHLIVHMRTRRSVITAMRAGGRRQVSKVSLAALRLAALRLAAAVRVPAAHGG